MSTKSIDETKKKKIKKKGRVTGNYRFIGLKLYALRRQKKMVRAVLANHLDITVQQLAKYESARNRIPADRLYQAAKIFGVNINEFFESVRYNESPVYRRLRELIYQVIVEFERNIASVKKLLSSLEQEEAEHESKKA